MAFTFIDYAVVSVNSNVTMVCNKPTWTVEWDIMFAFISSQNASFLTTIPTWRTLLQFYDSDVDYNLLYKVAWPSEPSTYTFVNRFSAKTKCTIFTYRWWFDISNPIDVFSANYLNWPAFNATAITVANNNSPLLFLWGAYKTSTITFTPPTSPWTREENVDIWDTTSYMATVADSTILSSSWTTWTVTATASSYMDKALCFLVALNPSVAPPLIQWNFFQFLN